MSIVIILSTISVYRYLIIRTIIYNIVIYVFVFRILYCL